VENEENWCINEKKKGFGFSNPEGLLGHQSAKSTTDNS